ncbi:MAG: pilus assembly protein [Candidatus Riflebacteria bacterium]|nr:pilus assembly protein [Candidatus Riflebacteria bacterium]
MSIKQFRFAKSKNRPRGQSLVEMALVLPLVLVFILGFIDLSLAFHVYSTVNFQCVAAATVARTRVSGIPSTYTSSTHAPLTDVQNQFWYYKSPLLTTSSYDSGNPVVEGVGTSSSSVRVSAVAHYKPFCPIWGIAQLGADIPLSGTAYFQKE